MEARNDYQNYVGKIKNSGCPRARMQAFQAKVDQFKERKLIIPPSEGQTPDAARENEGILSAYFIEQIWNELKAWMDQNPPGLGVMMRSPDGKGMVFSSFTSAEDLQDYVTANLNSFQKVLLNLIGLYQDQVNYFLEIWLKAIEDGENEFKKNNIELLREYIPLQKQENKDLFSFFSSSFGQAIQIMFNFVYLLQASYIKKEQKPPTPEELEKLLEQNLRSLMMLAASHDSFFMPFFNIATGLRGSGVRKNGSDIFKQEIPTEMGHFLTQFVFLDNENRLRIDDKVFELLDQLRQGIIPPELKNSASEVDIERIQKWVNFNLVQIGCPALYGNVIREMYQSVIQLAKTAYFQNLNLYNQQIAEYLNGN